MTARPYDIFVGQALAGLRTLPDGCARLAVTSPPYWALRDYNAEGQIGLEPTPEAWCAALVALFGELRRVLTDDGTLWVNCGDAYNAGGRGGNPGKTSTLQGGKENQDQSMVKRERRKANIQPNGSLSYRHGHFGAFVSALKPKDLIGLPWMLAFALRADGWWLRSACPWVKRSAMPESCTDRPSTALEYMFLFSKSKRYYFDQAAVERQASSDTHARARKDRVKPEHKSTPDALRNGLKPATERQLGAKGASADYASNRSSAGARFGRGAGWRAPGVNPKAALIDPGDHHARPKQNGSFSAAVVGTVETRNIRNSDLWFDSVGMLLADGEVLGFDVNPQPYKGAHYATYPEKLVEPCILAGSAPGDLVIDPFLGSGTTLAVACRLGRRGWGAELNPDYAKQAHRRIAKALRPLTARDNDTHMAAPLFGVHA